MIQIENLQKSFGEHMVLGGISLKIAKGQTIGIYGKSGIGKTTLAKILCGVVRPDGGAVFVNGSLLCDANTTYKRDMGTGIQMVYQQPYATLDPRQKIYDGFRELIRYKKLAATRQETDAIIAEALQDVGLEREIAFHLPHQISGGEAQRIAIARCLMLKPKLLILDEATSMLDVSTQANIFGLIRRAMKKTAGTLMVISHDRELLNHLCDRIYIFNDYYNDRKDIENENENENENKKEKITIVNFSSNDAVAVCMQH